MVVRVLDVASKYYYDHMSISSPFFLSFSAHGPRGTQAKQCIYVFRFHPSDGSMLLLNKFGNKEDVMNPAFSRFHPKLDVVCKCHCV